VKDEDFIRPVLLVLGIACMFLVSSSIAAAMARDGLVPWADAHNAVRGLCVFSTVMVALVALGRMFDKKRAEREQDRSERDNS
jgi:hypothetical protein